MPILWQQIPAAAEAAVVAIISSAQIEQLKVSCKPYKKKSYLTHHDAFAHFVTAFDLAAGHSIRDASGASQGARSQYSCAKQASPAAASCIFIEPQYADKDAQGALPENCSCL